MRASLKWVLNRTEHKFSVALKNILGLKIGLNRIEKNVLACKRFGIDTKQLAPTML